MKKKYSGKPFSQVIAKEDKPKKVKKKKLMEFARQIDTIPTDNLYKIKYTGKDIKHFFKYDDYDGNTKSLCWNFSAPVCMTGRNITLNGLRKLCDSVRNNFGVDITKDIKKKLTNINNKESPIHQQYIYRRNTLDKETLISRLASCFFTLGIVKYQNGKYKVVIDDENLFITINNNCSYNKKKSFKQKICLELQVLRKLKNFHFEELSRLTSSKSNYFNKVHLVPNNMYGHCVLTNLLTLSKVLPRKEAIQILYSLIEYREKFKEQEEYYTEQYANEVCNKTIKFVDSAVNNDKEGLEKSISELVNIKNSRKLKKKSIVQNVVSKIISGLDNRYVRKEYVNTLLANLNKELDNRYVSKEYVDAHYVTREEFESVKAENDRLKKENEKLKKKNE